MAALRQLQQKHPLIRDIRGRGLMIGVELFRDGGEDTLAFEAAMLCERRGLHITYSYFEPVLRIIPPLILSKQEVDLAISTMDEVFTILESGKVKISEILPQNSRSGPFIKGMISTSPAAFLRRVWNTSPHQWVNKLRSMRESS